MRKSVLAAVVLLGGAVGYLGFPNWVGVFHGLSSLDRYAAEGCVIAPYAPRPTSAKLALALGQAYEHEGWLLIGPAFCTIVPPQITATLKATDPDVAPFITAVDRNPEYRGCFLNSYAMRSALEVSRGWSEERAFQEYLRMFGAGVFSGEWRFFSESPLSTPPSVQYMGGECANVPYAEALQESHRDMIAGFDGFIRANAPMLPCEEGGAMKYNPWAQVYEKLGQGPVVNGFHAFEVYLALLGSEWIEGESIKHKGLPRPPICLKVVPDKE
ncbi:hypothetical protein [uncultured Sulfitobacter sp.]|uniref:hypothetical protein n=1 Tax=uncultured Sulfitobacter sp. TaxID=191468 RepID=UPI0026124E0E|nr:hypothetical protein [uncultured Sulfitobacter sp.]